MLCPRERTPGKTGENRHKIMPKPYHIQLARRVEKDTRAGRKSYQRRNFHPGVFFSRKLCYNKRADFDQTSGKERKNMKKLIALMLVLGIVLCGCSGGADETTETTTEPTETTAAPTETTAAPTEAPTEVPTTEPAGDPAVAVPVNPLTGEELEEESNDRPYAIMINNAKVALPHQGVAEADILYETCVESGMTRFMAIYMDPSGVESIGSIRSARPPYIDIVQGYDAIYCSASAASNVLSMISSADVSYLNAVMSSKFYRDQWRMDNMGYEHSMMVDGDDLIAYAKEKGLRLTRNEDTTYGLNFDESVVYTGETANTVEISFQSGGKTTTCHYNEELGGYTLTQYGIDYTDGNTNELVSFRNVLILKCNRWVLSNGVHVQMDTVGEGEGYYVRDGQIIPIKWSRTDVDSPFVYTTADGAVLNFGVGTTYVAVIAEDAPVSYE